MSRVRLSICIPTHNFGEFIGETLESIISQAGDDVEIVVGDGASTDNTGEVVAAYQARFPNLSYHRFPAKGGIDVDLARTIALAKGDYCWLLSSDDTLAPGAIRDVLSEIRSGHDVYLCNRLICDRDLIPKRYSNRWLGPNVGDQVFRLSEERELLAYLNASESIGALFSYMSVIIVRRSRWNEIAFDERFSGSNYAHVSRLVSIVQARGSSLKYLRKRLVLFRSDNDSFRAQGYVKRFLLDFDQYRRLGEYFFGSADVAKAFKTVMRRHHKYYFLTRLRTEAGDEREWEEVEKSLAYYDYKPAQLFVMKGLGGSRTLITMARRLKRLLRV